MPWFEIGFEEKQVDCSKKASNAVVVLKKFRDGTEIQNTGEAILAATEFLLAQGIEPNFSNMKAKMSKSQEWLK